jgi:ATP-binding cassette subfamily F protein 3
MLNIDDITLRRGPEALLEHASALIHNGQRVALIGANGTGKSSFFQLLLGELSLDAGSISLPGGCRIAHMAQEAEHCERSAKDYVLDGHTQLRRLQAELADAEQAGDENRMARLHGQLDEVGAYEAPVTAEKLLHGLGFEQADLTRPVSAFSGGWRIRLNLAQALMCPSDLLLLDEPTNHLDLDATLWLEQWLKRYPGTLILISHDRDFIDAVATHILHIEQRTLNQYTGNYSQFERQRAQKIALQQSQFAKQQRRIDEIHAFVARFKAKATKAKQAQSRLKELDRMELIAPAHFDSPFSFSFPESDKTSTPLINLQKTTLGYGDKSILRDVSLSIVPGARIGLLGPNGAGKSTLIKTLTGDLPLLAGTRTTGEHLALGYFAQHQLEALDLGASPALHLQRLNSKATDQMIRNFLGGFGFSGDSALAPVQNFSGGEKARLALAIIAWQRPNLLVLDEPTNHLDLEMRHALTVALQEFNGAVVIVSHDRHLLKNSVDQFYLVVDGRLAEFDGDLHDYERWLLDYQAQQVRNHAVETSATDKPNADSAEQKKERKRLEAEMRQKLSPLKRSLAKAEGEMERLQNRSAELEGLLADADIYATENKDKLKRLLDERTELACRLEQVETEWFELTEQLDSLSAELGL